MGFAAETSQLGNRAWRLDNLYTVTTKSGQVIPLRLNWMQRELLSNLHQFNIILKARQLGTTSFVQAYMLDSCLFNSNTRCGTIAHTLEAARDIFRTKVKAVYDALPAPLKAARPIVRDSADELIFSNGSSIRVSVSMRSGTLNYLHISEFAQVCSKFPERARETLSGSLNTLGPEGVCFVESTADGNEGYFYDMCEAAQAKARMGAVLTPLDWKFHFFAWHGCKDYELAPEGVLVDENMVEYFADLEKNHGIFLTPRQRAWYAVKSASQLGEMKREFPSTPEESFAASVEGNYYGPQMAKCELDRRIGPFPAEPNYPVHTSWDIGIGDDTTIWCFQVLPNVIRLCGYYSNSGEPLGHYLDKLELVAAERRWTYHTHFTPHDIAAREWTGGRTRIETMLIEVRKRGLGKAVQMVPLHKVDDGIHATRQLLGVCEFDAASCAEGIKALRNYRKSWNEQLGCWRDQPRHDAASHGADAFRGIAMSYRELRPEVVKPAYGFTPRGKPYPWGERKFKYLIEMSYDDFHRATNTEIGDTARRRRERV